MARTKVISKHGDPYSTLEDKQTAAELGITVEQLQQDRRDEDVAPLVLEKRLIAAGQRTTKLQLAFDALEFANGNVSNAKAIAVKHGDRISARTWHKAISARLTYLSR